MESAASLGQTTNGNIHIDQELPTQEFLGQSGNSDLNNYRTS